MPAEQNPRRGMILELMGLQSIAKTPLQINRVHKHEINKTKLRTILSEPQGKDNY